jgi:hypothetical protein
MTLTSLGRFRFAMMPVTNLALSLQGRGLTWFREARFRGREMNEPETLELTHLHCQH